MRPRSKSRSSQTTPSSLETSFREIVVGDGRSQEPYIIAFHYASDNVSGSPLGTLFGFFEVEIHDQDAAYIVNFLSSVAKKEYFTNPRRNVSDSFEAALHKINIALTEIVKHGNVSWLGHLHGAIGAVSQNTIHFSVTGDGQIFLARTETLRSISDGLTDSESESHPLKTFSEVSSGELFDADIVFALSPSVWSLFSPEDLLRNLNHLGPTGFEQFLRTALVNELPVAAVALFSCAAPIITTNATSAEKTKVARLRTKAKLDNVWSSQPFHAARENQTSSPPENPVHAPEEQKEEYIDQKTGHIYVQASPDEAYQENRSHWKNRWELFRHKTSIKTHRWGLALRKTNRRIQKESAVFFGTMTKQGAAMRRYLGRRSRVTKRSVGTLWQQYQEKRRRQSSPLISEEQSIPRPLATAIPAQSVRQSSASIYYKTTAPANRQHTQLLSRIAPLRASANTLLQSLQKNIRTALSRASRYWHTLSPMIQRGSLIVVTFIGLFIGVLLFTTKTPTITETPKPVLVTETPETTVFPPADEPLAIPLSESQPLSETTNARSIALMNINNIPFLVTEKSIINLQTKESISAPESLRLAAGMDDLDAIFTLSQSGSLFLFSITTKKFELNTLPLPTSSNIDAIGSYLTYLYVLDQGAGTIYRFPRAEGGFGSSLTWSKTPITTDKPSAFVVNESILLANPNGQPMMWNRGKAVDITFAATAAPITADILTFDSSSGDIFALDRSNKRIIRWSATGTLIHQYFHESLRDAETFLVSPDGTKLLVSSRGATTAWRLP